MPDPHELDPAAIRRAFDKAASSYDQAAALHHEVSSRLLERLNLVRGEPKTIVDLGAGSGRGSGGLKSHYRKAQVIALDLSFEMLQAANRHRKLFRKFDRVCGDAESLPLRDRSVDWCISNLMLAWCDPPDSVFAEVQRILKPQGLFSFTTFGPDTLIELRRAWESVEAGPHVHRFLDMHDLGDALLRSGFAEPVMDTERITVTYSDSRQLMRELKNTGATTATKGRNRSLANRTKLVAVSKAYEMLLQQNRLPVTLEIVYGQAWLGVAASRRGTSGETRIPLEKVRAALR